MKRSWLLSSLLLVHRCVWACAHITPTMGTYTCGLLSSTVQSHPELFPAKLNDPRTKICSTTRHSGEEWAMIEPGAEGSEHQQAGCRLGPEHGQVVGPVSVPRSRLQGSAPENREPATASSGEDVGAHRSGFSVGIVHGSENIRNLTSLGHSGGAGCAGGHAWDGGEVALEEGWMRNQTFKASIGRRRRGRPRSLLGSQRHKGLHAASFGNVSGRARKPREQDVGNLERQEPTLKEDQGPRKKKSFVPHCGAEGCSKGAYFAAENDTKPLFCSAHKEDSHKNIRDKRCQHAEGCWIRPSYGDHFTRVPRFCFKHKKPAHIDLRNKMCQYVSGCSKRPSFGDPTIMLPRFCKDHKQEWHVPCAGRLCEVSDPVCYRRASFGIEGGILRFCGKHKSEGDVDLRHKVKERTKDLEKGKERGQDGGPSTSTEDHHGVSDDDGKDDVVFYRNT